MKYKIGVDVDGVLRDFPQDLFRVIERDHPDWLIKNDSDSFVSIEENWELEKSFNATDEEIKQLYRIDAGKEILADGLPYQDNVDYLRKEIQKQEHDFVCVTSQHPSCSHHTLTWLGKHQLNFETVYFRRGEKKWMVECDFLIDDSPENWTAWKNGRGSDNNFILINQKWNESLKATNRVDSIEEALNIIYAQ